MRRDRVGSGLWEMVFAARRGQEMFVVRTNDTNYWRLVGQMGFLLSEEFQGTRALNGW